MKKLTAVTALGILVIVACSKSSNPVLRLNQSDIQNVDLESAVDLYFGDPVGIANSIIQHVGDLTLGNVNTSNLTLQGKTLKKWDKRLACAIVTITSSPNSTTMSPQGSISIYYDSTVSCTDSTGTQRKGTITIIYNGPRYAIGSTRVLTYQDYFRNGIKINGISSITNLSDSVIKDSLKNVFKFTHLVNGGSITFSDGKTITRNQNFTAQWNLSHKSLPDTIIHYYSGGTANGIMRDSVSYQMVINEDLYYSGLCLINNVFIPVNGSKTLRVGTTAYNIDYGSGECNKNGATITLNGLSKLVTISP